MSKKDLDAKKRLIKAAAELLNESGDIDEITVRQIAERANVGIGLINYHFKSRDNLLGIAVGDEMSRLAGGFSKSGNHPDLSPDLKLKVMLKELCNFSERHRKYLKFAVTQSIINGDRGAELYLIPILREIFAEQRDEISLRIIALQILAPLQVVFLNTPAFRVYSGIELDDENQRNRFIDILVDHLIARA